MLYLTLTYITLQGKVQLIELANFVYGEWIIYNGNKPTYHVSVFNENCVSDATIKILIENKLETIETILRKINACQGTALSLKRRTVFGVLISTQSINWSLDPLPIDWIKSLN